jgi:translation initiation factor IF-2
MPVSAKEKTGINELLDMVLLVSDVEEHKADKMSRPPVWSSKPTWKKAAAR